MKQAVSAQAVCIALLFSSLGLQGCGNKSSTSSAVSAPTNTDASWLGTWKNVDGSSSLNMMSGETLKMSFPDGRPGAVGTWKPISSGSAQVSLQMGMMGTQALTAELKGGELTLTDGSTTETFDR